MPQLAVYHSSNTLVLIWVNYARYFFKFLELLVAVVSLMRVEKVMAIFPDPMDE
jgi:hypothetical protein